MLIQGAGCGDKFVEVFAQSDLVDGELWRAECAFPELERMKGRHRCEPLFSGRRHDDIFPAPLVGIRLELISASQRERELDEMPEADCDAADIALNRLRFAELLLRSACAELSGVADDSSTSLPDFSFQVVLTYPPIEAWDSAETEESADCGGVRLAATVKRPLSRMFDRFWRRRADSGAAFWEIHTTSGRALSPLRGLSVEPSVTLTCWANSVVTASMSIRKRQNV